MAQARQEKACGLARLLAAVALVLAILTACGTKASPAAAKIELGQKYLTELNYTEAVASFTEAIQLDPDSIPAYMGRAQAYTGLAQHPESKADYTTAIEKAAELPYTQAEAYAGRAEVNEKTDALEDAKSDYTEALTLLDRDDVGKKENIAANLIAALKAKILNAYAQLCIRLGLYDEALAEYDAVDALYAGQANKSTLEAHLMRIRVDALNGNLEQYMTDCSTLYDLLAAYDYADYTLTEEQQQAVEYLRANKESMKSDITTGLASLNGDQEGLVYTKIALRYQVQQMLQKEPDLFTLDGVVKRLPDMEKSQQAAQYRDQGDYASAIALYTELMNKAGAVDAQSARTDLQSLYYARATAYVRQGSYDAAVQDLQTVIRMSDAASEFTYITSAYALLGEIHMANGNFAQAAQDMKNGALAQKNAAQAARTQLQAMEPSMTAEEKQAVNSMLQELQDEDLNVDEDMDFSYFNDLPAEVRTQMQQQAKQALNSY